MAAIGKLLQGLLLIFIGREEEQEPVQQEVVRKELPQQDEPPGVEIAPTDPLVAYFLSAPTAVEIDKINLESPALHALKSAGVKMVVPLVNQGELVGLLNLGPRRSEKEYSADDRGMLNALATQAAPAVRMAQFVREQRAQARARERLEHELRVARLIQQTQLPRELPEPPGWKLAAYWTPARAVGGDFYDFLSLEDGRLGIVIGDVTDKGIPAALVMATTRSILRAAAQEESSPGKVLARVNALLCPDIPPKMFVTCLYAILDPARGTLCYANAGHDLPYLRRQGQVCALRASGMPLGLMPDTEYEEKEEHLQPGESVFFYSDGLVEAHNPQRQMFGAPRLMDLLQEREGADLLSFLLARLTSFTGPDAEQEDDVTMVLLERLDGPLHRVAMHTAEKQESEMPAPTRWRILDEWDEPSKRGNERLVMERVARVIGPLNLPARRLEHLKTAVAEATLNAMEHGNNYQPEKPVHIRISSCARALSVSIQDQGGRRPAFAPQEPDLEAKLCGKQTPRGWGLFLIRNLVDEFQVSSGASGHTLELIERLDEPPGDSTIESE